jgi:hypothetical protein
MCRNGQSAELQAPCNTGSEEVSRHELYLTSLQWQPSAKSEKSIYSTFKKKVHSGMTSRLICIDGKARREKKANDFNQGCNVQ